ncbi:VCBS repeat-containing protein [Leeuwenhoekiella palythoae]|uniref:VCBS repeat-containing protein n=1 Tax=Leeuwenhoekiella palythoae TaxID=573501 RepID=UPI003518F30B
MIRYNFFFGIFCTCFLLFSCDEKKIFTEIDVQKAGLNFENTLTETDEQNVMTYEYFYNGGGVAVADFNNDGYADVYLSGNQVKNKLFLNLGEWQFKEVTNSAKLNEQEGWKTGVTAADVNGDGLMDIYLSYSGNAKGEGHTEPIKKDYKGRSNALLINQGNNAEGIPVFKEMAKEYGLDAPGTFSTQAYFLDYDLDGDLDLFLLNHANKFYNTLLNVKALRNIRHPYYGNKLFENRGNSFVEVSEESAIKGTGINFGLSAAVSDLNNDGYPDIYVTNDYVEQDFCYINNRDGSFKEVSKSAFGHLSKFSMGSDIADLNNDQKPDVFVLDMLPEDNYRQKVLKGPDQFNRERTLVDSGYHHQYMRNTLQLNRSVAADSSLAFSEQAQLSGISNTDWSWAPLLADFDNDGLKDIFITNGYLRDFSNLDFTNYTVNEAISQAQQNNTNVDIGLLVSKMSSTKVSNYIYQNKGEAHFENKTAAWGFEKKTVSNAAAYADFDNDGDLDLIVNNLNAPIGLYENTAEKLKHHYLKIQLKGASKNTKALGTKILLQLNDTTSIFQEANYGRGYQASVEPVLTIGLGNAQIVEELKIIWPAGKISGLKNVKVDQTLVIDEEDAISNFDSVSGETNTLLKDVTAASKLSYTHQENSYQDFNSENLILYRASMLGGNASVADLNNDGNDDIYFEAAKDQPGVLYLGKPDGTVEIFNDNQPWLDPQAITQEDLASLFFDADGDGDLDLYVVSGGNEEFNGNDFYQDRLYLNDGDAKFSEAKDALPDMRFSGGTVKAEDFDNDGDLDLFVGGRISGKNYPMNPKSMLLENTSDKQKVVFKEKRNYDIENLGMVTDAVWDDLNEDGLPDLIVVGEWMPVTILLNTNGNLSKSDDYNLNNSTGWWTSIVPFDFDNDGDTDYLLGNMGLNSQLKASVEEPMRYYVQDIDNNGRIDPILSYYIQHKNYPLAGRDELIAQAPGLKKHFPYYEDYAKTTTEELLEVAQIKPRFVLDIKELRSSVLVNNGKGSFDLQPLPKAVQTSVVQDFIVEDFNSDGIKEVLTAGNFFPFKISLGQMDASFGSLLQFKNGKWFSLKETAQLSLRGDIRDLNTLHFASGVEKLLVTRNNDSASLHRFPESN